MDRKIWDRRDWRRIEGWRDWRDWRRTREWRSIQRTNGDESLTRTDGLNSKHTISRLSEPGPKIKVKEPDTFFGERKHTRRTILSSPRQPRQNPTCKTRVTAAFGEDPSVDQDLAYSKLKALVPAQPTLQNSPSWQLVSTLMEKAKILQF
ncbi:hypothetical protein HDV05_004492 [Chytridiales sp. JEL 0842]|nr:hypothetical protein HDV05_004492 [Chytridiales sp. JEL 0842]